MAVDVLRSFHSVDAWMDEGQTIRAKLRWYPCKQGAKALPIPTAFGSAVWEPHPDEWTKGPGVEHSPLTWRRTRYPAPKGDHFHGEPEAFLNGITPAQYADAVENEEWISECYPQNLSVRTVADPEADVSTSARIDAAVDTYAHPKSDVES